MSLGPNKIHMRATDKPTLANCTESWCGLDGTSPGAQNPKNQLLVAKKNIEFPKLDNVVIVCPESCTPFCLFVCRIE